MFLQLIHLILLLVIVDAHDKVILNLGLTRLDLLPRLGQTRRRLQHIAPRLGERRRRLLDPAVKRLPVARLEVIAQGQGTARNIQVERGAHEELVRGDGLVRGDHVARLEDAREGVVAELARDAAEAVVARARPEHVVLGRGPFLRAGVRHGEGGALPADPVARVVAVAVHHVHLDATVEQVADGVEEAAVDDVVCAGEVLVHGGRDGGEVDGRADGAEDVLLHEVAVKVRGRERVGRRMGNVEPAVAEGVVEINGGAATPRLDIFAHIRCGDEATVDGVHVELAELALTLSELVLAAARLCPVGLELSVDGLVEDLNIKGLYASSVIAPKVHREFNGTHIFVREVNVRLALNDRIDKTVYDTQRIEVDVVRMLILNRAILDLLILLLEEPHEPGAVVSAVALRPQADLVVLGLVVRELGEPRLGEVPERVGRLRGAVGRLRGLLAGKRADLVREITLGNTRGEVRGRDGAVLEVDGSVGGLVEGEADLVGLVDVQDVDKVVPGPGVHVRGPGVLVDDAGPVLAEEAQHG